MANFCPQSEAICVARGDSPVIPIRITDLNNDIVDITGFTFVMTVDPSPVPVDASNNLFQLTVGPIPDGTSGIVQFQPSSVNLDQQPSVYFYDIQMLTITPSKRTVLSGQFEIQQDISKV